MYVLRQITKCFSKCLAIDTICGHLVLIIHVVHHPLTKWYTGLHVLQATRSSYKFNPFIVQVGLITSHGSKLVIIRNVHCAFHQPMRLP